MWVFCCGMQRSGSTLQYQIAARLVEQAGLGQRLEWVEPGRFPELRELKQRVRDRVAPGRDLGHSERGRPDGGRA